MYNLAVWEVHGLPCRRIACLAIVVGVALVAGCCVPATFAQLTGSVTGICKDEDGNPIVGATVEYDNTGNGRKYKGIHTNKRGAYFFLAIQPGTYNVLIRSADGKPIYKILAFRVTVGENTLDFDLKPRSGRTHVDVIAEEMKLYADSRPYLDDPPFELERAIPDLRTLEPASSQDQLPSILASVGTKVDELLQEVPNLICDETVSEEMSVQSQTFNYIVLVHETENEWTLEEYRTDRKGRPIAQGPGTRNSVGFVSRWVVFSPANDHKSRFRYLGEQRIGSHSTFVVAFAQTPGAQSHPGEISVPQGGTIPTLYQGVAWIDESDFRILRLRTDLLAPQPQVGLKQLTATIQFGSVRIAKLEAQLWLPQEVKLDVDANGQVLQELHRYSQYRLYKANTKIVTGAP